MASAGAKVRSCHIGSKHGMSAVLTKSKHPRFWHYAGTGFSVIDTRIFQDERMTIFRMTTCLLRIYGSPMSLA